MSQHYTEDELTLYYYGEARAPRRVELHLESCEACRTMYRDIAGTLAMIAAPDAPERDDQYGLEVWQRIRHALPEQEAHRFEWFAGFGGFSRFLVFSGFSMAAAAALLIGSFVAGRTWQHSANPSNLSGNLWRMRCQTSRPY